MATIAQEDQRFFQARIIQRQDISSDLWKIRIDPGGDFKFIAGQYATLGVRTPAKHFERAYSIVSSPYEHELEIFVELVPHGALTPQLYNLPVGAPLTLRKLAKGRFTLDCASPPTNHLLLCTVTGIAPFVSYARTLAIDWEQHRFSGNHHLYIIQGASRSWEFGYREELQRLSAQVPWLTYVATVSRPWEDPAWDGETGRVEDLIRKYTAVWDLTPHNTTAYLCGHPQMIDSGKGILQRQKFDKPALKEEIYWIPPKPAHS
jgi:ferredoxin/flavodoxin---NADP+ reductase